MLMLIAASLAIILAVFCFTYSFYPKIAKTKRRYLLLMAIIFAALAACLAWFLFTNPMLIGLH